MKSPKPIQSKSSADPQLIQAFRQIFTSRSPEEVTADNSQLLSFAFLSEVEHQLATRKLTRRALATRLGTSASYLTQLFNGDRLLNLTMLARLETALDIRFHIRAVTTAQATAGATVEVVPGVPVWIGPALTADPKLTSQPGHLPTGRRTHLSTGGSGVTPDTFSRKISALAGYRQQVVRRDTPFTH